MTRTRNRKHSRPYGTSGRWAEDREHQQQLYPGQREALSRREEGQGYEEIAAAMGVSRPTVTSYLVGARIFLGAHTIDGAAQIAKANGDIPYRRPR